MSDVVERVVLAFGMMRDLDQSALTDARQRVTHYIEKLTAAGQTEPMGLCVYGLAYLRELQDGPGKGLSGC